MSCDEAEKQSGIENSRSERRRAGCRFDRIKCKEDKYAYRQYRFELGIRINAWKDVRCGCLQVRVVGRRLDVVAISGPRRRQLCSRERAVAVEASVQKARGNSPMVVGWWHGTATLPGVCAETPELGSSGTSLGVGLWSRVLWRSADAASRRQGSRCGGGGRGCRSVTRQAVTQTEDW